jgi:glutamate-1-semialdehyde 2,1-aminomutase/spore coat polysaccharide biosynthesis protein SpsF
MSRFVLNGNDATSGAVRLARHVIQRDHIAKCGYHGWQDWSICTKTGRNNGIPEIIKTMTHDFKYNDIESLRQVFKKYKDQIAAVILEPASDEAPKDNFLQKVKELTHQNGAILIFDELVTGFRWSLGGAQEYFNVIPDIACFGKAISNGYPIAVICGKAEYMKRMDEIFVSMTFGGFIPGLVASIECINMMREAKNVHKHMHQLGNYFIEESNKIIGSLGLPLEFIGFGPHPIMKILIKDDYQSRIVKTFIYQEMNKAGILFSSSMTIGYKHTKKDIDLIIKKFKLIGDQLAAYKEDYQELKRELEGEIVAPRTIRDVQ